MPLRQLQAERRFHFLVCRYLATQSQMGEVDNFILELKGRILNLVLTFIVVSGLNSLQSLFGRD